MAISPNQIHNILIVEDNEFTRKTIASILRGHNYYYAKNGKEAVAQFIKEKPQIVYLDIGLPDASGLDLITEFKASNPEIFIVMVSGDNDNGTIEKAKELGAKGYITKPFSINDVNQYLDKYRQENIFDELF